MIVVKVELWPGGDESNKRDLGTAHIWCKSADGKNNEYGEYGVKLLKGAEYSNDPGGVWRSGKVSIFPRTSKSFGPWELLALALEDVLKTRLRNLRSLLPSYEKMLAKHRRESK